MLIRPTEFKNHWVVMSDRQAEYSCYTFYLKIVWLFMNVFTLMLWLIKLPMTSTGSDYFSHHILVIAKVVSHLLRVTCVCDGRCLSWYWWSVRGHWGHRWPGRAGAGHGELGTLTHGHMVISGERDHTLHTEQLTLPHTAPHQPHITKTLLPFTSLWWYAASF